MGKMEKFQVIYTIGYLHEINKAILEMIHFGKNHRLSKKKLKALNTFINVSRIGDEMKKPPNSNT